MMDIFVLTKNEISMEEKKKLLALNYLLNKIRQDIILLLVYGKFKNFKSQKFHHIKNQIKIIGALKEHIH